MQLPSAAECHAPRSDVFSQSSAIHVESIEAQGSSQESKVALPSSPDSCSDEKALRVGLSFANSQLMQHEWVFGSRLRPVPPDVISRFKKPML